MGRFALCWVGCLLLAACGPKAANETGSLGTEAGGGTAVSTATLDTTSGTAGGCPTTPPADGVACTGPEGVDVAHCSWGDDPRPSCRTTALCSDESWVVTPPDPALCVASPLPNECGDTPRQVGTTCPDQDLACWYGDGQRCWCSPCEGGADLPVCQKIDPPQWACAAPPQDCPSQVPQAGQECATPGLSCGPECELEVICEGGVWVWRVGICPMCAAPTTAIATPSGDVAISTLRAGDLVYSMHGKVVTAVPLLRVGSTAVANHRVIRVQLARGAVLEMSPRHPTADGRTFAELRSGGTLDGHSIVSAQLVNYTHSRTYDILPASDTGTYFAFGVRVGSSLR